jgi:hypothetical protein
MLRICAVHLIEEPVRDFVDGAVETTLKAKRKRDRT